MIPIPYSFDWDELRSIQISNDHELGTDFLVGRIFDNIYIVIVDWRNKK